MSYATFLFDRLLRRVAPGVLFAFLGHFIASAQNGPDFPGTEESKILAEIDLRHPSAIKGDGVSMTAEGLKLVNHGGAQVVSYAIPAAIWNRGNVILKIEMALPPYQMGTEWYETARIEVNYPQKRYLLALPPPETLRTSAEVIASPPGKNPAEGSVTIKFSQTNGTWEIHRLYFVRQDPLVNDSFPWKLPDDAASRPVHVSFLLDKKAELNRKLLGFNCNFSRTPFGFGDPRTEQIIETLKPGLLRFPNGTQANFYDWRVDGWPSVPSFSHDFVESCSADLAKNRQGIYGIDDFILLCRKHGIVPDFVLNLTTLKPSDADAWATNLIQKGIQPHYFELGNELYDPHQAPPEVRSGAQYVAWARPYAEAVQHAAPGAQVALLADLGDLPWNQAVAQAGYNEGVVIHTYDKMDDEPFDQEVCRNYLLPDKFITDNLADFDHAFGPKAHYWNTEWNIHAQLGTPALFASTLNTIFCAGYLLTLLEHQDRFELACFHQLGGLEDSFGLLTYTPFQKDTTVTLNQVFFGFTLFGRAFEQSTVTFPLKIAGTSFDGHAGVLGRGFADDQQRECVIFLNRLPVAQKIILDDSVKNFRPPYTLAVVSGSRLSESKHAPLGSTLVQTSQAAEILLPPYSVSLIKPAGTAP